MTFTLDKQISNCSFHSIDAVIDMPSIYPWFIDALLRALITAASSLAYSPVFNPRRTEDTTYGIWTTVLIVLAERSRPFF